jgi:hypothetical protein
LTDEARQVRSWRTCALLSFDASALCTLKIRQKLDGMQSLLFSAELRDEVVTATRLDAYLHGHKLMWLQEGGPSLAQHHARLRTAHLPRASPQTSTQMTKPVRFPLFGRQCGASMLGHNTAVVSKGLPAP